jgi:hypothetical protein
MNQLSSISFGNDATVLRGYAQAANERLGAVDFLVENTGNIPLVIQVRQYDGLTSPSGYANVGAQVTVNARGKRTIGYNLLAKRVGFFGSGVPATVTVNGVSQYITSTTANITAVIVNKGDLTGRQIDLVATGREGWSYDAGFARPELKKKWGTSNPPGAFGVSSVDPTTEGV